MRFDEGDRRASFYEGRGSGGRRASSREFEAENRRFLKREVSRQVEQLVGQERPRWERARWERERAEEERSNQRGEQAWGVPAGSGSGADRRQGHGASGEGTSRRGPNTNWDFEFARQGNSAEGRGYNIRPGGEWLGGRTTGYTASGMASQAEAYNRWTGDKERGARPGEKGAGEGTEDTEGGTAQEEEGMGVARVDSGRILEGRAASRQCREAA